jgi:hypothetical protein
MAGWLISGRLDMCGMNASFARLAFKKEANIWGVRLQVKNKSTLSPHFRMDNPSFAVQPLAFVFDTRIFYACVPRQIQRASPECSPSSTLLHHRFSITPSGELLRSEKLFQHSTTFKTVTCPIKRKGRENVKNPNTIIHEIVNFA